MRDLVVLAIVDVVLAAVLVWLVRRGTRYRMVTSLRVFYWGALALGVMTLSYAFSARSGADVLVVILSAAFVGLIVALSGHIVGFGGDLSLRYLDRQVDLNPELLKRLQGTAFLGRFYEDR